MNLIDIRQVLTQVVGFLMLENGLALLAVLGTY
jgi:hydrogenase-4 membrane subunit HyfE